MTGVIVNVVGVFVVNELLSCTGTATGTIGIKGVAGLIGEMFEIAIGVIIGAIGAIEGAIDAIEGAMLLYEGSSTLSMLIVDAICVD